MSYEYFLKTGDKFMGSETEFQNRFPLCNKFCTLADEEGRFEYFLCGRDFNICRQDCRNHKYKRTLDPEWEQYFKATCERYKK